MVHGVIGWAKIIILSKRKCNCWFIERKCKECTTWLWFIVHGLWTKKSYLRAMYQLIKPLLFKFDPEKIHHTVTAGLKTINKLPGGAALSRGVWDFEDARLEKEVFGLKFRNPVGLAAGFDKNAELIGEMGN